jgi:hypothetical protein
MTKEKEYQNVYANTIDLEEIHISKAESGRRGYYCQGCNRELQAMISRKAK